MPAVLVVRERMSVSDFKQEPNTEQDENLNAGDIAMSRSFNKLTQSSARDLEQSAQVRGID
jgi:hypothetical protein